MEDRSGLMAVALPSGKQGGDERFERRCREYIQISACKPQNTGGEEIYLWWYVFAGACGQGRPTSQLYVAPQQRSRQPSERISAGAVGGLGISLYGLVVQLEKEMNTVSVNRFRESLKAFTEEVLGSHEPLRVTRRGGEAFVDVSEADWERCNCQAPPACFPLGDCLQTRSMWHRYYFLRRPLRFLAGGGGAGSVRNSLLRTFARAWLPLARSSCSRFVRLMRRS